MPLPKPNKGEKRKDFMERCHSDLSSEFPDSAQRNAVRFALHSGTTLRNPTEEQ